ncbi:MAG: BatD family protein [Bacteroidales bacterium]|jgi:hypothetical protein|nr:BatD family protein [Bacteroidales bacterium]
MRRLVFILTSLFLFQFTYADEVNITTSAPSKVGVGQRFEVKYSINQKASNVKLGDYSNFILVNGPSTSSSNNVQIINGSISQSNTYSYSYVFEPKSVGKFNLPTFSVTVDGKTYTSQVVSIEVQKDPVQSNNSRGNRNRGFTDPWEEFDNMFGGGQQNQQVQPQPVGNEDLFVRIFINKTELYKGEPIIATIKVFTSVDLYGFEDFKIPAFNSFYAQEIESPERITFTREIYNNKSYNTAVLKKYILYPRVSGELTIEPCELDCQIRQSTGGGGFWNPFGNYQTVKKIIYSPELKINVKNLPSTNISSFNGAVGNYNIKLDKTADTVNVNDAVNFKLTLSGTGNFNMIEPPKILWPDEFEVYDPVISDQTSVTTSGISGSKTWEYTVVPRYPGMYKMGKINFTYFDLSSHEYKTQVIDNLSLAVRKDANDTKLSEYNYTQRNVEYIGNEDIRFIKNTELGLKKSYNPLILNSLFSLFYIIPIIIFIVIIIILRKQIKENSDLTKVKAKKANKISQRRLKKAKKYMLQSNKTEFYKEVISALWGYIGDKLSIPVAELTKPKIRIALETRGIDESTINQLINIIEKCEFAHFSPSSTEVQLDYIYKEAVEIIDVLEQKIK